MKAVSLDGVPFPLKGGVPNPAFQSALHKEALSTIRQEYPGMTILEEVQILLRRGKRAALDIVLPSVKLVVEVQGRQHYEYVGHYHGDQRGFLAAQDRDEAKLAWCELNEFELLELRHDDREGWGDRLREAVGRYSARIRGGRKDGR